MVDIKMIFEKFGVKEGSIEAYMLEEAIHNVLENDIDNWMVVGEGRLFLISKDFEQIERPDLDFEDAFSITEYKPVRTLISLKEGKMFELEGKPAWKAF